MANRHATDQVNIKGAIVIEDVIVPAGGHWGRRLNAGQYMRLIDLEGQQAVDFLCYSALDSEDRYNAANTMKLGGNLFLGKGTVLWSERARKLATIVEDTCGSHDTIGGCCSSEINELRYGVKTPSCRENFLAALKAFGLGAKDIVANVNFFMNVPVGPKGEMAIMDGLSKPGDHVDLRAEMDLIALMSNCPQRYNPASGYNPTPVRVVIYSLDQG